MDLASKNITPQQQLDAAYKQTNVMVEYMERQGQVNNKVDKALVKIDSSIGYQKWLMVMLLLLLSSFIGVQVYRSYHPLPTDVERKLLREKEESIRLQNEYLDIKKRAADKRDEALSEREKRDSMIAIKNTADALINLKAQDALAIAQQAVAKSQEAAAEARAQLERMQENSVKRDSLFNQKKQVNAKTVNANNVNTVNANSVNVKK